MKKNYIAPAIKVKAVSYGEDLCASIPVNDPETQGGGGQYSKPFKFGGTPDPNTKQSIWDNE